MDIFNYRKVQTFQQYIDLYNSHGIHGLISVAKLNGLSLLVYPGGIIKREVELLQQLSEYLSTTKDYSCWDKFLKEAETINKLYEKFYDTKDYKKTCGIPEEEELAATLIALERTLHYLHRQQAGEIKPEERMRFSYRYTTSNIEESSNLFDLISLTADKVLTFLLFYKDRSRNLFSTSEESIDAATYHFINIDKKEILDDLVQSWQCSGQNFYFLGPQNVKCTFSTAFGKDCFVTGARRDMRREIISSNLWLAANSSVIDFDPDSTSLNTWLSHHEWIATKTLEQMLFVDNLNYDCTLIRDSDRYQISLKELVRAYAVLREEATAFLTHNNSHDTRLENVCLTTDQQTLIKKWITHGLREKTAERLIELLRYCKKYDYFDCPLIQVEDKIIIIPSAISQLDIARIVCSIVDQFKFEGTVFEDHVLNELKKHGIHAERKLYHDATGKYQCDVLFAIDKDLFICECKAWGASNRPIGTYNRYLKMQQAAEQLTRIAEKYLRTPNLIETTMGRSDFRRYHKLVILAGEIGCTNKIGDTTFVESSLLFRFLERKPPGFRIVQGKSVRQILLPQFPEYNGLVTSNKMERFLDSPTKLIEKSLSIETHTVHLDDLCLSFDVYKHRFPMKIYPDDEISRHLDKFRPLFKR